MKKFKNYTDFTYSLASFVKSLNYEVFQSVKSFIVKCCTGSVSTDRFEIEDAFSYTYPPGILSSPSIVGFDVFDNVISKETALLAVIKFKGERYLISCTTVEETRRTSFYLIVSGRGIESLRTSELTETLIKEAIANSGYFGKIIRLSYNPIEEKISFRVIPPPEVTLDDIYLKNKDEIMDFIEAVSRGTGTLRYLFVGEPGTGKTETIKAIISECARLSKKLTIIITDAGCHVPLHRVFEYAEIFSPAVLCIDDIDLLIGSRESRMSPSNLAVALQSLDGFLTRDDIFLLATTNDRNLVDHALRRPGRFDLIIEFGALHPDFYSNIVYRETKDEKLASLFNEKEIKGRLLTLKPTGAFLVILVKYLMRPRFEKERYNREAIIRVIDSLSRIFKKEAGESFIGF